MKRLHIHSGVADLEASIRFYSTLFGAEPSVVKPDYAKWMLDDPRVNFAISTGRHDSKGIEHLGIQAEDMSELREVYGRLEATGLPSVEEGRTTCCYARSEKSWIADPDGILWETFYTDGESVVYGEGAPLEALAKPAVDAACCDSGAPQGICCEPKQELPAGAPCCG